MAKARLFQWGRDDSREIENLYKEQIPNLHQLIPEDRDLLDNLLNNEMNYMDKLTYKTIGAKWEYEAKKADFWIKKSRSRPLYMTEKSTESDESSATSPNESSIEGTIQESVTNEEIGEKLMYQKVNKMKNKI